MTTPARPVSPAPFHIHGHSARIGIELAYAAIHNQLPAPDLVEMILAKIPAHITVDEFAVEILTHYQQTRMQRRRDCAMQIVIALTQRAGDPGYNGSIDMDKIVELAWSGARKFEEQDNAAASMETLTAPVKG